MRLYGIQIGFGIATLMEAIINGQTGSPYFIFATIFFASSIFNILSELLGITGLTGVKE